MTSRDHTANSQKALHLPDICGLTVQKLLG